MSDPKFDPETGKPLATTIAPPNAMAPQSVVDRLRAAKDAADGRIETILPVSGMSATYPAFINHNQVLTAIKQAGKDRNRIGAVMIAQHVLIEGERLKISEVTELMHNDDVVHLTNRVLGEGGGDEDGEGN